MIDVILLATGIGSIFLISVSGGYVISRRSKRAGILVALAGVLLGIMLIVNYFVEVPLAFVAASFSAVIASMIFALFEEARRHNASHPV